MCVLSFAPLLCPTLGHLAVSVIDKALSININKMKKNSACHAFMLSLLGLICFINFGPCHGGKTGVVFAETRGS
jgi:hypothetical protein